MHRQTLLSLAVAVAAALAAPAGAQTLIAQYPFDGDLQSVPINITNPMIGNAPTGTLREGTDAATAPTGVATFGIGVNAAANSAVVLDGVDDWIDMTTLGRPNPITPGNFSFGPGLVTGAVVAWVRATVATEPMWLLGSDNVSDPRAFRFGFNGTQLEMRAQGDAANESFGLTDPTTNVAWADGAWHHLAVTWDGINNSAAIYVDGGSVASVGSGSTFDLDSTNDDWEFPLAVGARDNGGTIEGFWNGMIDDLRIYASGLSANEINQIFGEAAQPDADFNGDMLVDGGDFLIWQRGYDTAVLPEQGDANGDGAVDAADLGVWQQQYGEDRSPASAAMAGAVPEPGVMPLASIAAVVLAALHQRRRFV